MDIVKDILDKEYNLDKTKQELTSYTSKNLKKSNMMRKIAIIFSNILLITMLNKWLCYGVELNQQILMRLYLSTSMLKEQSQNIPI